ncbi:protein ANKUB1-like isoform X2 [Hydractinia symbiolongicarpus]|nr:protein ANKUB1-like isoform X2 [Hydractinia symbiolongicarpus]
MKITALYKRHTFPITIDPTDTFKIIRRKIRIEICNTINLSHKWELRLYLHGVLMPDNIVANDIGLKSGDRLHCRFKEKISSELLVLVKYDKRTVELREKICFETSTVEHLRVLLQNKLGIPVSLFRLVQVKESVLNLKEHRRELFDIHTLKHYDITEGDIIHLEVWKNTKSFLIGALKGDIIQTLNSIPSYYDNSDLNRYLLRVALFIAAHKNFAKLAVQIMQRGIRCEEAVGEHPSRQWCVRQSHPEVHKTAVHQAAEQGSLDCLQLFLRHSPASVIKQDGYKLTPSNLASLHRKMECWKLLISSQFMYYKIRGIRLTVYARIMQWCYKARERIMCFKGQPLFLQSNLKNPNRVVLGNALTVNGVECDSFDSMCDDCTKLPAKVNKKSRDTHVPVVKRSEEMLKFPSRKISVRQFNLNKSLRISSPPIKSDQWKVPITAKIVRNEHSSKSIQPKKEGIPILFSALHDSKLYANSPKFNTFPEHAGNRIHSKKSILKSSSKCRSQTEDLLLRTTGLSSRDIAQQCLKLGLLFEKRGWWTQMDVAMRSSKNIIQRREEGKNYFN